MASDVTQIKVTLPNPLLDFVASKAGKFGLTLSAYVKHLIVNDVKDMDFPVYQMSPQSESVALKAIKENDQGKTKIMKNIDQFVDGL